MVQGVSRLLSNSWWCGRHGGTLSVPVFRLESRLMSGVWIRTCVVDGLPIAFPNLKCQLLGKVCMRSTSGGSWAFPGLGTDT